MARNNPYKAFFRPRRSGFSVSAVHSVWPTSVCYALATSTERQPEMGVVMTSLKVKNLVASITKDNWDSTRGILTIEIPVRELKAEALKMGLVPNEDGEVFANLNYQHASSGFRFTYRSSIALGEEISTEKIEREKALLAEIAKLQAQLGKK